MLAVAVLAGGIAAPAIAWLTGRLIAELARPAGHPYSTLMLLGAVLAGQVVLQVAGSLAADLLDRRSWRWMSSAVVAALNEVPHVDTLLEPQTRQGVAVMEAAERAGNLSAFFQAARGSLSSRLSGAGLVVLVGTWSPIGAGALLIAWLAYTYASNRWLSAGSGFLSRVQATPEQRRGQYLRELAAGTGAAKEQRVFGLAGFLLGQYRRVWFDAMRLVWRKRSREGWVLYPVLALLLLTSFGVLLKLATDARAGRLEVSELTTLALAVIGLSALGPAETDRTVIQGRMDAAAVERLLRHLRTPAPGVEYEGPAGIRFDDVSFSYDGKQQVLDHLDLTIMPGELVAIVGRNGAGKSTLSKLIAGHHLPQSGRISVNGTTPLAARRRGDLAVVPQAFTRYPADLGTNLDPGGPADRERLEPVLRGLRAGQLVDLLDPPGLQLGAATDLSGGQWQKVAVARALLRKESGASVVILDEPTASLDLRSEIELFDAVVDSTDPSTTTLLITHRLSSVRDCDRILVLEGGRIIQDGAHDDLVAVPGLYRDLYRTQQALVTGTADQADQELS
ncbi:MAG: ATP-binding cassette, subfamily bacterial [Kribbellaceae bacterium]|nr:ATP-binding cassette, subfamily bacterial [Kribbellaceae bacterium]